MVDEGLEFDGGQPAESVCSRGVGCSNEVDRFGTLFSFFAGVAAIGAVGARAGYLVRERSAVGAATVGIAVDVLAALIVAVADAYLAG